MIDIIFWLIVFGDYTGGMYALFGIDGDSRNVGFNIVWESVYHWLEFLRSGLWLMDGQVPPGWLIDMAVMIGTI